MMVRSNVQILSIGLFVIGLSCCAGRMPSEGEFKHPALGYFASDGKESCQCSS